MDIESIKMDLERVTGQRKPDAGEPLTAVLQRLDTIAKDDSLDERLEHYLSKRSYVKALAWINDPSLPHQM